MKLEMTLNGRAVAPEIHAGELLVDVLRRSGCWSVKRGCQDGNCGTCVVQLDGENVCSCLVLAGQAQGREVTTVEGVGSLDAPHPIQAAFVHAAATQCGFCTPGIIMSAKTLLDRNPDPTDEQIREALDGNLCRCTGYVKIFDAVREAAAELRKQREGATP